MKNEAVERAAQMLNGLSGIAKALAVTVPTVSQWRDGYRPVPIGRCVEIEIATGGQVTRKDLRPDDWQRIWPELNEAGPV